VNKPYSKR